jgi:hypothetical protein
MGGLALGTTRRDEGGGAIKDLTEVDEAATVVRGTLVVEVVVVIKPAYKYSVY